jgi:nucleotide-binding universal stress UspA family protein
MKNKVFIVPYDFTEASEKALNQAIEISKSDNAKIITLHIVAKESEVSQAKDRINFVISELNNSLDIEGEVVKGSIFNSIGEIAEKNSASAIIMGTHGAKGMQKVFGSFAMKVIISTGIPFMVLQKETPIKQYNNICLSIDASAESIQIIKIAADLAKTYNAKIFIIAEKEKDSIKARKIKNNLVILSNKMHKLGIDYNLELIENEGEWIDTVINFAKTKGMDMFAYSYDSDRLMASKDKFSQALLFNPYYIPALIINAKKISSTYF